MQCGSRSDYNTHQCTDNGEKDGHCRCGECRRTGASADSGVSDRSMTRLACGLLEHFWPYRTRISWISLPDGSPWVKSYSPRVDPLPSSCEIERSIPHARAHGSLPSS